MDEETIVKLMEKMDSIDDVDDNLSDISEFEPNDDGKIWYNVQIINNIEAEIKLKNEKLRILKGYTQDYRRLHKYSEYIKNIEETDEICFEQLGITLEGKARVLQKYNNTFWRRIESDIYYSNYELESYKSLLLDISDSIELPDLKRQKKLQCI